MVNNKRLREAEENRAKLVRESKRWRRAADTAEQALTEARAGTKTDAELVKRLKRLEALERGLSQARPSPDSTRELHITRDLLERLLRQKTSPLQQHQDELAVEQAALRKDLERVRAAQETTRPAADIHPLMSDDGGYRQAVRDVHDADIALAAMKAKSIALEQTVQDLRLQLEEARDDRIPAVHAAVMKAESNADIGRQALDDVERLTASKVRVAAVLGQQMTANTTNTEKIKSRNALEKLKVQVAAAGERAAAAEREVKRVIDAGNRRNDKFAEMHSAFVNRLQSTPAAANLKQTLARMAQDGRNQQALSAATLQALTDARLHSNTMSQELQRQVVNSAQQVQNKLTNTQTRSSDNIKRLQDRLDNDHAALTNTQAKFNATQTRSSDNIKRLHDRLDNDHAALTNTQTKFNATQTRSSDNIKRLQDRLDNDHAALTNTQARSSDNIKRLQDRLDNDHAALTNTQARSSDNIKRLQDRLDNDHAAHQAMAQQLMNTQARSSDNIKRQLTNAESKANVRGRLQEDMLREASVETAAVRQTTEDIKALLLQNQAKAADLMARLGTGDQALAKQADAITTLISTVDKLTTEAAAAQQKLVDAQEQASIVEANTAHQHQNKLQQAEAQSKAAVQAAEATVSALKVKLDDAEKMRLELQKALEGSEATASGALAGKEELQQKISNLQAAGDQQQAAALSKLEAKQAEVDRLKEDVDKSSEKVAALTKEAEVAKREGSESADALSRELEAETSAKQAALEELRSGRELVEKLKGEVAAAGDMKAANKAKLAGLSDQLQAAEAARNKLEHNLQDTTKNAASLRSDATDLRQQSADLQRRLDASLEVARTQLQNHSQLSTELQSQIANLQKVGGVDKTTIEELKRHVQAAAEEKNRLEHQVADSTRAAATALKDLNQHRTKVNSLQANLNEEKGKARAREEEERKLQMDLISHQEREKALEAAAANLEAKIKENEAVTAELTRQHDGVVVRLQQAVATVDSSEKTLAAKSAEILKLTDQVKAQDEEHIGLKRELAEAAVGLADDRASREKVVALTAEMEGKEAELQAGREELKSQNSAWQQLLAEKQRIEKEVDERQAQHQTVVLQEKQKYSELMLDYTKVSQELKDRLAAVAAVPVSEGPVVSAAQLAVERDLEKLIELGAGEQYTADLATLRSSTSTTDDKTKVLDKARQYQQVLVKLRKSAFVNVIVNQWDSRRKAWSTLPFPISVMDRAITIDGSKRYKDFYSVRTWSPQSSLSDLFTAKEAGRAALEDNVREAAIGMNSVIFTYGQSGSGKTASLLGRPGEEGLTGLALKLLAGSGCVVIHGETFCLYGQIRMADVCNAPAGKTQMEALAKLTCTRKTPSKAVSKGTRVTADSIKEIFRSRPDVHPTPNNDESSRSHLFMTWSVTNTKGDKGYLTFVDLAGAESPAAIALVEKQRQLRERQLDPTKRVYLKDALYNMLYTWNTQPKQQRPQGRTVIDTLHEGFYINETLNNLADFFVYRKGHTPQPRTVQPLTKRWLAPDMETYKPTDGLAESLTSMYRDPTGFMLELNALEGLQRTPAQMAAVVVVNPTTPTEMQGVRDTLDYADRLTK